MMAGVENKNLSGWAGRQHQWSMGGIIHAWTISVYENALQISTEFCPTEILKPPGQNPRSPLYVGNTQLLVSAMTSHLCARNWHGYGYLLGSLDNSISISIRLLGGILGQMGFLSWLQCCCL